MIGTSQLINAFGAPVCFTDTTDIFKDGSGVALYGLDYDGSDAGGASGKFGEAAIFNGSSSVVTINSTFDFSSSFSISMWFNADTLPSGTYMPLFFTDGYGGPSSDYGIALYLYGNTIKPWIDRQGTYTNIFTAGTLSTGTWYHVVLNRDYNSKWELFLNGLSLGTYTGVGLTDNYTPSSFSTIGKHSTASTWFDGKIDQVRIFNTAPIQSQVTQLFQENSSTVGTHLFGCVANYNLDGSAKESMGTTAYDGTETDITYRYDGTPTAVDFGVGGKINYGARFNGSSSYINLPNLGTDLSGSNTRTLSAWVKLDSNPSVYSAVVSYGGAGSLQSFGIYMSSTGTPRISYYNLNWDTSTSLTLGNWYHIVGIYKGGNVETSTNTELYINGQIQTLTITNSLNLTGAINTSNTNYAIGYYRASPSGSYFNGDIDQVRAFNKALSSAEVGKLYGDGAGEIACAYTSTTDIVNYPSDTTPVAYYKLDNSSEDYSTGGNDGTATNVEYKFGRYGQAAVFNGSSSAIVLPNNILNTSEHSISLWFNLDDINGIQTVIEMDYENRILFRAVSTDSNLCYIGSVGYFDHGISFSANQWYHLVITFSAGNPFKIYVDGVLSYTGANSNIKSQTIDNVLGASNPSGANGVDGKIDQVRIYSTALTSSQVTKLYEEKQDYITKDAADPFGDSNSVALYEMENNVNDTSGNNNNGTTSNVTFTSTDPIRGTYEATFNGSTNDIGLPQVMGQNNYTFSAWFKTDALNDFQTIFSLNANGSYKKAIFLHSGGTNNIRIYSALNNYYSSNNIYNTNQWYHIVFTKSSTNGIVVYLDANEIINEPTATANDPLSTQGSDFIGAYQTSTAEALHFDGSIDQVRIFDRALDGTEAYQLYAEGARGTGL